MSEIIVETKKCRHCAQQFSVTQGDLDFYAKISPIFGGQKFDIPTPTLCPACRQRRRLAFRNERNLYRRICDASGKQIISIYSPDKPYKVYNQKIWRSDTRDALEYGKDFCFPLLFKENFAELMNKIPRMALNVVNNEGSEYVSFAGYNKNCYLIYTADQNEYCMYGSYALYNKMCLDFLHTNHSELCYQVIHTNGCFNCSFCLNIKDSSNCSYCLDMVGCRDCFLSYGKTTTQYCFKNTVYSKELYEEQVHAYLNKLGMKKIELEWEELIRKYHDPQNSIVDCVDCEGVYLTDSNACVMCENCTSCTDLRYCSFAYEMRDSMDWDFYGDNGEWCYNCVNTANNAYHNVCSMNCWGSSRYLYYCDLCMQCEHCFGCIGLRNKSYCIFNKQYTKDEYEKTVAKIITHMQETGERGEFFHPSLSPFGYNETVAQEYYPCSVIARSPNEVSGDVAIYSAKQDPSTSSGGPLINYASFGYKRSTYESPKPVSEKVIKGADLPESIDEVDDSILQYAIECAVTGKLFRIQPQELVFYRKHGIPLPRKHPDQRHLERLALRK